MSLKAVLFDLDGTLLPMDMDAFTHGYFKYLCQKAAPRGYAPKALTDAIWSGTAAMIKNNGEATNEEVFWHRFAAIFGQDALKDKPMFDEFYAVEFQTAQKLCGFSPLAAEAVRRVKAMGARAILATNPIFPAVATYSRIRWAGLTPEDFDLITTYENIGYCKPNLAYYEEILHRTGLAAEECLMVGNDVAEDMVAEKLGMQVFLLTDCLINKTNADISRYPHGDFPALLAYLEAADRI